MYIISDLYPFGYLYLGEWDVSCDCSLWCSITLSCIFQNDTPKISDHVTEVTIIYLDRVVHSYYHYLPSHLIW